MAYLQAKMRERVFIQFPASWKKHLPDHLHEWVGRPLLLLKALYGYNFRGKFLYLDQAKFLVKQGFEKTGLPGLWIKHLPDGKFLMFSHYVDNILTTGTDDRLHEEFLKALRERFDVEIKP